MSKTELIKRYVLFVIGLFFIALGIAFIKHSSIGITPISSVANVMNTRFPQLSLGTWAIVWNLVLILGQILILRRNFQLIQLWQIPLSVVFGRFIDLGMWMIASIPTESYIVCLLLVLVGTACSAFGISLSVIADVVLNSGEGFIKAVVDTWNLNFGNVKTAFDISCVIITVILSFVFYGLRIVGIREATLISAVLTGNVVKIFNKLLPKPVNKFLKGNSTVH